jgi:putative sterol carrier protein
MATIEEITDRIRRQAEASGAALDKTIKLDLKGEGFIHIAGSEVTNEDRAADLVVRVARKDLEALGKGELDPMRAVMTGRLKLSDMGLAIKLLPQIQSLFSRSG